MLLESGASRAIEVLGDAWVLRLLRSAFRGTRRFSDFLAQLDVSRAVLSDRLQRMVADRLLERHGLQGSHAEYRLTERGMDAWGILLGMWQWERDHGTGIDPHSPLPDRPRREPTHTTCGSPCGPVYACERCREPVTAFDTAIAAEERLPTDVSAPAIETDLPPRKRYRKAHGSDRNALPILLRTYGDRWNTALMAAALQGARSFSDFERSLAIGPTQLADRLLELQALGLLRPRSYAGSRQAYHLTRKAIATYPITLELMRWGDRWLWNGQAPLRVAHQPCHHVLGARWQCAACGGELLRQTLRFP